MTFPFPIWSPKVSSGWADVSTLSYEGTFGVVASSGETNPYDVAFNDIGTKMFIIGNTTMDVHEYTLSTAWNVSSASYVDYYDCAAASGDSQQGAIYFKPDGTKLYTSGRVNDRIYQHSLSTPWDISTASYDSKYLSIAGQIDRNYGFTMKPDGTALYATSQQPTSNIWQYTLSTPWDVSTGSYSGKNYLTSSESTQGSGIQFHPDGNYVYVVFHYNDRIYQLPVPTPWDVSSITGNDGSFVLNSYETAPRGCFFKEDGSKFYTVGQGGDAVDQFSLG